MFSLFHFIEELITRVKNLYYFYSYLIIRLEFRYNLI